MTSKPLDDVLNLGVTGTLSSLGVGLDELESEDVTLVSFVLDMSSSMVGFTQAVIQAYNTETQALRSAKGASAILVSTTTFTDVPALLHGYQKLDAVTPLDETTYRPDGSTALYDAVMGVLARLEAYRLQLMDNGVRARGIVVALSDGEDCASRRSAMDVRNVAERLVREEWATLAYVGFGQNLQGVAASMGFPHVMTANQTAAEIRRALGQVSQSILRTTKWGAASFF